MKFPEKVRWRGNGSLGKEECSSLMIKSACVSWHRISYEFHVLCLYVRLKDKGLFVPYIEKSLY